MLALTIAIISTTSFSLIIRHSQRRGYDQMAIMALNYLAASGAAFACSAGRWHVSAQTWEIGITAGVIFVLTYLVLIHSMSLKGVAIANAVTRLAVLIPVLGTILIFGEKPRLVEGLGAGLAILAMPFLSLDRSGSGGRLALRQVPLLAALFVTNGVCMLMAKWFHSTGLLAERGMYYGILFGVAGAVSVVAWLGWSRRGSLAEVLVGVPLGVINFITGYALLIALDTLKGTLVFPVFAAMGLALTTGFAAWAWREIPGRLGQVGIAIALVAVVLINA